jgi:hypothetical protein
MKLRLLILLGVALAAALWWLQREMAAPARDATPAIDDPAPAAPPPRPPAPAVAEPAEAPAVEKPAAPAPRPAGVTVVGRVVGAGRRPAPGANVTLRLPDRTPLATRADGAGRFVIAAGARPAGVVVTGGLVATDPAGQAGAATLVLEPDAPAVIDAGTIGLRAGAPLTARVVDAGTPVPGARVFAWVTMASWGAETRADEQGLARFAALPTGAFRLLALADGPRRAMAWVTHPQATGEPFTLALERARTIEVTVVDAAERPVEGATIDCWEEEYRPGKLTSASYLPPVSIPPTDARGRTSIFAIGVQHTLRIGVWRPGRRPPGSIDSSVRRGDAEGGVKPGDDSVRIQFREPAELRWAVASDGLPAPPDGTALELDDPPDALPRTAEVTGEARVEGGEIVVRTPLPSHAFHALAVAPDGSIAILYGGAPAFPRQAGFRPGRRLEVVLRERGGTPLVDWALRAHLGGDPNSGRLARTDSEGRAHFDRLFPMTVEVTPVEPSGFRNRLPSLGSVDLKNADGRLEVELPPEQDVVVRVSLQGVPGLPPQYTLTAGRRTIEAVADDPERAELRFRARPAIGKEEVDVRLQGHGFVADRVPARAAEPGGPLRAEIDLQPVGTLLVRITGGEEERGDPQLRLERRRDADGAWTAQGRPRGPLYPVPAGAERVVPLHDVKPGRYRVHEAQSGVVSTEADVAAGGPPAEVRLALTPSAFAEGRVVVPEGTGMSDVRVIAEGIGDAESPGEPPGFAVDAEGGFRVHVPSDRVVRLRPFHPLLAPAPPDASVSVQGARTGLVLRLAPGPTARFRTPDLPDPGARLRVLLFRGAVGPEPAFDLRPTVEEGVARFGGFAPGVYVAWFDLPGFAPLATQVSLGDGETDLGDVRPGAGSTLQVERVQAGDRISVFVEALDPPVYWRSSAGNQEEGEVLVRGLGAGRFRARIVVNRRAAGTSFEVPFETDGVRPVTLRAEPK